MTAQTFTAIAKRRAATYCSSGYGHVRIDATADTALAAITTSSTVADVLEIVDACIARSYVVTANSVGDATSVKASNAPSDIALSAATLAVNANGSVTPVTVGTLSATASDAPGNLTYSLVAGTGSTNNALFSISGTTLRYIGTAAAAGTRSIRVRVTDSAAQTYEEAFTITVA
jgi:large repetitive protein